MAFRSGQSFFLAVSLSTPATIKIIANNQIFHHLIFFGFASTCGILFRLRLVISPPNTINTGKTHGVLKRKYVAIRQNIMIAQVIVSLIETPKAITEA